MIELPLRFLVHIVAQATQSGSQQGSCQYIARVVNAEVDATIGYQGCPKEDGDAKIPVVQKQAYGGSQSKTVGGMVGNESVGTAPVVVYQMDAIRNNFV